MFGFLRKLTSRKKHKEVRPPAAAPVQPAVVAPPAPAVAPAPVAPTFVFTLPLMRQLFRSVPEPRHAALAEIAAELNAHLAFYKLDTPLRRTHFFAQILQETGEHLKIEEGFHYSATRLTQTYRFFRDNPDKAAAHGYKVQQGGLKADGCAMCRTDYQAIANFAYGGRMNNGPAASGDGWKYRGRGLKQLTGKANYQDLQKWHELNQAQWPDDRHDFLEQPDLLLSMKYAARSAAYFWLVNGMHKIADQGEQPEVVDKITRVINKMTDSDSKRREHFERLWKGQMLK
ncbi:hypothetical protein V0R50_27410 [Pseudomonas sp. 148P]|uniref:Uncharacterized protein n=1 Tax=Pseudomonas ulcerans TaxID=3115852 RepID=A0ABU7HZG0_9PSED|nr:MULTISPECIES: hypothetical protein [unclassified Pseudomonas]MEE1925004.1 hypothetical protein [Pseudomonas sp. 147P]MEE1936967.1 hypothetical protein [Pseudomonas sp. 148P]